MWAIHHIHRKRPSIWNSRQKGPTIYLWPEEDRVKAFHYDANQKFHTRPLQGMKGNQGMPGGFLSISANGQDDGILWAAIPYQDDAWVEIRVRGTLRAFNADTLQLLWSTGPERPGRPVQTSQKTFHPPSRTAKVYLWRPFPIALMFTASIPRLPTFPRRHRSYPETRAIADILREPRVTWATNTHFSHTFCCGKSARERRTYFVALGRRSGLDE